MPKLVDGRNKFFFFASYSTSNETIPGRNQPQVTIPTSNHLNGDFSDLLRLPNPSQYQIYDPLTVRPDPIRPGKFIRTPFPNNIIPRDRFMNPDGTYKNPLFGLYAAMLPHPNQNFASATQAPVNNYFEGAQPNLNTYTQGALRLDGNLSDRDRVFFRTSGSRYFESLFDWTYEAPDPKYHDLHSDDMRRYTWAYEGNWTRTAGRIRHRYADRRQPVRRAELLLQAARLHAQPCRTSLRTWTSSAPPAATASCRLSASATTVIRACPMRRAAASTSRTSRARRM